MMQQGRSRHAGRPLSPAGRLDRLLTLRITDKQRDALFQRARANGYRYVTDYVRDQIGIDLLDSSD